MALATNSSEKAFCHEEMPGFNRVVDPTRARGLLRDYIYYFFKKGYFLIIPVKHTHRSRS